MFAITEGYQLQETYVQRKLTARQHHQQISQERQHRTTAICPISLQR